VRDRTGPDTMGTYLGPLLLVALALLAGHALADSKCKAGCAHHGHGASSNIFAYVEGNTYVYSVEGTTVTSLTGAKGEATKLSLKATAELSVEANCAQYIKLSGVSVTGPDGKKYDDLKDLEKHPLRFNFHDGHIDAELCTAEGDSQTALNVKRAVLSLFQVAASQSFGSNAQTEVDVYGSCPTDFQFSKDGDTLIVRKERNLNRCAYREDFRSDILSVGYAGGSPLQNTPLMASSLKSTQKIKNKILDSAESVEEYFYRPLSNRDAGAKTVVETKIKLVSTKKQGPSSTAVSRQRSIIFEVPHTTTVPGNADAISKAIHKAHENMKATVGESSARDFGDIVAVLRQSTKDDILKAFKETHHKVMFIDALIRTGTGDAVQAGVELIKQKEIKDMTEKIWYMNLGFVRHANPGALASVASLIDPNSPRGLILGAGALAGRYCREHECDNKAEFNTLISKLAGPLGSNCKPKDKADENKIIASLKAIHNIHNLNDAVAKTVSVCASDVTLPSRIRVFALEAFHGDACIPKLRETALNVLKNTEEDSELRIKAYLALVDCPNGQVANALKEIIEKEPSYQVGAFIVSHLRNLRASANPDKASAKAQLGNIKPTKRFPNDLRKFSRNFEVSTLIDLLNIGASAESNVIFSQKSFVPRSASLNLTTDIFGHSVNLLDFGIRAENVDRVLEHIFGPKGYIRSNNVRDMFTESQDKFVTLAGKVADRFSKATRGKRSVSRDQINAVSKKVSLGPKEFDADLDLDISVRVFGFESIWLNYQGGKSLSPESIVDKIFDGIDAGILKAKKFNYDIRKHYQFLDTDLTYPTGLGLPLKLSAVGNAAIHLQLDGKLDIHAIMKDPKNAEAKLHIVPSAAIELNGLMVVDAIAVQSGLKLSTTVHSATGSDVTIKILDGAGIDVNFGLPIPKQDVITLKSEIFSFKREKGQSEVNTPLSFNTKRKDFHGCFDQLSPVIGLTFCSEVGFPAEGPSFNAALFPLNGPAKLSIKADKDDDGMTGYRLKASYDRSNPHKRSLEVLVDTPGSKTNRKLSAILEASSSPEYAVKAALISPWKKVSVEGQIIDNEQKQMLVGKLLNDKAEYSVKVGLDVTGSPDARTYAPVLEYSAPGGKKETLTGKDGKKQPINIEGTVTIEKKGDTWRKYKFNGVAVNTPMGKYGLDGAITKDTNLLAHDLKLILDKHTATLKTNLQKLGPNAYKAHIEAVPNQAPDFSFALDWDYKRENNQIDNNLIVAHGANLKAVESRVTLNQQFSFKGDSVSNFEGSTKQKLTYPLLGVEAKLDAAASRKTLSYDLAVKYGDKKLESKLNAKANQKSVGDYDVNFNLKVNDKGIALSSQRSKPAADKVKAHHSVELTPGGKYELSSDVTYNFEKNNINYLGEHLLKLHQQPDIKVSTAVVYNPGHFNTHCYITYGDTKYLDTAAKLDRNGANPAGNYKIIIKDYFDSHGDLKYTGGKGSGSFVIDIPKVQRKIKGSADLTISGNNHKLSADLLWNADKDPKQKIHFETDSDLTRQTINSKNTLIVMDWKLQANLKREATGTERDGSSKSDVEVILPNGRKLSARYKRETHIKPDQPASGEFSLFLEDQNGSAVRTSSLKVSGKGIDVKQRAFDVNADYTYKCPDGKDLAAKLSAKNTHAGDKWVAEGKGSIKGSYLSKPAEVEFNSEATKTQVTYKLKGSGLSGFEYDVQGKVMSGQEGNNGQKHSDIAIDLKLPSDYIKHIKYKNSYTMTAEPGSPCQVGFKHLYEMLQKIRSEKGMKLASAVSLLLPNIVPSCEVKVLNELVWDEKTAKLNGALKADLRRGSTKVILTLPNDKPRAIQTSWVHELDQEPPKLSTTATATWDEKKEAKFEFKVEGLKDFNDIKAKLSGTTNVNTKHNFEIDVLNKRKSERASNTDVTVSLDDKKVNVGVDLDMEEKQPKFDIKIEHPGGKLRVASKTVRSSDKEMKNEGELQWPYQGGGKLTWAFESKCESIDNFDIKAKIDSEKLKLNKYDLAIASKPGEKKQITFSLKSADQNIVSGSTNYEFKEEGKVWSMEGSGNVQVKSEARSSHFKFTRKQLNLGEDKEVGEESILNVDFGGKESIQLERKLTNRQQRFINVFCDKDKKCARIEFDNNVKTQDFVDYNHALKVVFDLKSLGVPHDFTLDVTRVRHGRIVDIDTSINMDTGAEKTSLSSKLYAHEKSAGIIINLPKRTIEALAELSNKKEGSFKGELAFWIDKKRQPNLKSSISLSADVAHSENGASLAGEARFAHPGAKDLVASSRVAVGGGQNLLDAAVDLDVFADQKQKVVLEAKVAALQIPGGRNVTVNIGAKSKGLNLDVELLGHVAVSPEVVSAANFLVYQDAKKGSRNAGIYAKLSKEKLILVATVPGSTLLKVKSDLKIARDVQSIDSNIELFGLKPIAVQGEIKDLNSAIFNIYKKEEPNKKLSLKGGFGWGQVAEIRATKQSGDAKQDLFYVTVALDESHFLQTEYGGSYDSIKATIDGLRKEGAALANQAKIQVADAVLEGNNNVREVADEMNKAKPNLKPVIDTYQKELKALSDELANEKLAKEITDLIKEAVARITAILDKIQTELHKYVEILEKPLKRLSETFKQWASKLAEVYGSIAGSAVGTIDAIAQVIANYMSQIVELVHKHEEDIKKIATTVGQGIQDIGRIVSKAVGQIRHEVEDFVKLFMEQLKALPIYEVLKERYAEIKKIQIPDQTWNVIRDMIDALGASMPTPEVGDLLQSISSYVEKHLKHEKVNDLEELKGIYNNAILALKSIVNLIKGQISQEDIDKLVKFTAVPLPGSSWFQLPIFAPIHFSPLKWLQSGDLPSLSDAYYTYRPTLNPLDWVPPYKMYGILVDSNNFYTFDRKYYNFKGACSYVLAQDFVDGNFSLIVNLEGGKFKSILLNDAKDSIELESDMSILVNGKPQDFPALQGGLSAWRRYDSANLRSDSGVFVTCDLKRQVCQFFLSGFYFGKTRGLLGNMNYEQFDDLVLPNGKIASKISEFGNAWKVNSECADVPNVEHDHARESYSECANFFSGNSALSSCFPYINPGAFRTACDHAATEAKSEADKKKAACNLAFAYTQSCRYEHVKVDIPSGCTTCSAGGNNVAIGDVVSVKSPQTSADIILVVEQITPNEEVFKDLVVPLIASLSNELKGKGITDVHFSLLGFGAPDQKWPSHYTSGGDLSFEGKSKNIWFGAPTSYEKPLDTMEKKIKWVKHQVDLETGNLKLVDAFQEAGEYPFRAGAVKSIIGVMGQACESSLLPISLMQIRTHLASYRYRDQGISLHIISPLNDLALDNDKPSSEIVGFDSDHVYTLGDDKKKPFAGSSELREHLKNESDACIKVALASYGSAFSSKNFLASKPPQRKQFVSVVSKRVTDSLAGGEITQDCKCSLHDGLHPKINCRVVNRTEKRHG